MADIRERIRQLADACESVEWLANQSGIPRRTIYGWMKGPAEPKAAQLAALATATGASIRWLVLDEGVMFDDPVQQLLDAGRDKDLAIERSYAGPDIELVKRDGAPDGVSSINPAIFKEVKRMVRRINDAAGIRLPDEAGDDEAIRWYNELVVLARGSADEGKLQSLLPALDYEISQRVKAATANPGTGKRSVS